MLYAYDINERIRQLLTRIIIYPRAKESLFSSSNRTIGIKGYTTENLLIPIDPNA